MPNYALMLEQDHEWKDLVRLAAEHDIPTLKCMRDNWHAIADMYGEALHNPHITGSYWHDVRRFQSDAQARAWHCEEALTAADATP